MNFWGFDWKTFVFLQLFVKWLSDLPQGWISEIAIGGRTPTFWKYWGGSPNKKLLGGGAKSKKKRQNI